MKELMNVLCKSGWLLGGLIHTGSLVVDQEKQDVARYLHVTWKIPTYTVRPSRRKEVVYCYIPL